MIVLGPRNRVGPQGEIGPRGLQGKQGEKGDSPQHEWLGTRLRFQNPDGTWGKSVELKGPEGKKGDRGFNGGTFVSESQGTSLDFLSKKSLTINANETKVIDTIPLASFRILEYTFSAFNMTELKTKGLKMLVKYSETSLNDQVFGRIGDQINFSLTSLANGLNYELSMTNNESYPLNLTLIRASL